MPDYRPPVKDTLFVMQELSGLQQVLKLEAFAAIDGEVVQQVVEESARFAADVLAPLNEVGDREGCRIADKAVQAPASFADAYQQFVDNGWQSLVHSADFDGMGLPEIIGSAVAEYWHGANLSFGLCPLLTAGAIAAIEEHASDELKRRYLPKMVMGQWSGTMNLTEPQAGSDLAAVSSKAVPAGDHYLITGSKIFITWGDHSFAENIVHLVLARLPGAPDGVRGISLFLVPKFLLEDDGNIGKRNDVYPVSIEHKMGIHGSPTCVMSFGENGGAIAYLVGEENKGLACMFTMMNHARIEVGIQGLAISERAYQAAASYARERVQGRAPGVEGRARIIDHADIRRILMVMRSQIEAMRAAALVTASYIDIGRHSGDESARMSAASRMALLTPVIKAWLTEVAQEITSLGVQVHGGMGFVEETGVAQYMRDARILPIYEGTTGIQANDFIGRKIIGDDGRECRLLIGEMRELAASLSADIKLRDIGSALDAASGKLQEAVDSVLGNYAKDPHWAGAASVNLLLATGTVYGAFQMARAALAVTNSNDLRDHDPAFCEAKLITAEFYCEHILPRAVAYATAAMAGSGNIMAMPQGSF